MNILDNPLYFGSYIGQRKLGKKEPMKDGYKGSGHDWRKYILSNHVPVEKEILCMCESVEEANEMEQFYIEQYKNDGIYLWNRYKGGGNHEHGRLYTEEELKEHQRQYRENHKEQYKQWREDHKEELCEKNKQWYEGNKEYYKQYKKRYREANKEHISNRCKRYRETHKEEIKKWYEDHKEELCEKKKQYREVNKEQIAEYDKQYREVNKEKIAEHKKQYREVNKEKIAEHKKQYDKQLCSYNGETLTLSALSARLGRMGIEHSTIEAKKYLIKQEVA